jgi:hypothetical protein
MYVYIYIGSKYIYAPSEELRNGVGGEDGRAVPIGDTLDFGLKILVGNHGDYRFEGVAVGGGAVEFESLEVLGLGVSAQDLGQDPLLHRVGVSRRFFDELERLRVLLAGRRAERRRYSRVNSHLDIKESGVFKV